MTTKPKKNNKKLTVAEALKRLQSPSSNLQAVRDVSTLIEHEVIDTLEPLLPLALRIQGKPYTLADHAPFGTMYRSRAPRQLLMKTGRQCAKSTNLAASTVMNSYSLPYFRTLHITPLFEQIRRFSSNVVRPFIETSPLKNLWRDTTVTNSVLQKSFNNQSLIIFSFALGDAERVRGVSADLIVVDEVQDFLIENWPVVEASMSASKYKLARFCGTPKSKDNTIETFWQRSSQAEWVIKCRTGGCNKWNIPHLDHHLIKMIGPYHRDISEKRPGTVCYHCQKPIFPRDGRWLHAVPERRTSFAGYHVPQIVLPMHFASPEDWAILVAKMRGENNTTFSRFCNEILGESVDVGQKLVSLTEIKAAARLPATNNPNDPDEFVLRNLRNYVTLVLGVDWGGGGETETSYTVLSLVGYKPDGSVDVLWGKRLVASQEHVREAAEVRYWMERFGVQFVAHDYSGAGSIRETLLRSTGIAAERILPMSYMPATFGHLIQFQPETEIHNRTYYKLNKTRSLLYLCNGIKYGKVSFFRYDGTGEANVGLLQDFLALTEQKVETRVGDIYLITRNIALSDDFAHATNFATSALWHLHNSWPDLSTSITMQDIDEELKRIIGDSDSWEMAALDGDL